MKNWPKVIPILHCDEAFGASKRHQLREALKESNTAKKQKVEDTSQIIGKETNAKCCYAQTLQVQPVSKRLHCFLRTHIHKDASLQGLEAGDDGDCLFQSIDVHVKVQSAKEETFILRCTSRHTSFFRNVPHRYSSRQFFNLFGKVSAV